MNKILVKVFFPRIDRWYEVWIPINQKIYTVISQLYKGINELNDEAIHTEELPILYNRSTGEHYELDSVIQNTNIVNGTELIFI